MSSDPWPLVWDSPEAIHQQNVKVTGSRLRFKLLVYPDPNSLKRAWKALGLGFINKALGVCSKLSFDVEDVPSGRTWIEVDPRLFCAIGLTKPHLKMGVITTKPSTQPTHGQSGEPEIGGTKRLKCFMKRRCAIPQAR